MHLRTTLSLVILLSLLFMVGCGGGSDDPKDIVKDSFTMIENNNVDGLSDILASSVKGLVDREKLEKGIAEQSEEIKEKGGISNIEFVDEKVEEEQIDYKIKLTYGDGSTKNEKVRLVKEDGEWKLGISK